MKKAVFKASSQSGLSSLITKIKNLLIAICSSFPCPRGGPVRRVSWGQGSSKGKFLPREWLDLTALSLLKSQELTKSEGGIVFLHFQRWKCRGALFYGLGLWICSLNSYKYLHYYLEAIYMSHAPSSCCYPRSRSKSRKVPLVMYIWSYPSAKTEIDFLGLIKNRVEWILLMMTDVLPCILLRKGFRLLKTTGVLNNWSTKEFDSWLW